jgi:hypothetical protein
MNMNALMAQAKKLQGELEKTTKEIEGKTFTYDNENILIEATGDNHIRKVEIKNNSVLEDKEILEDILVVAINDILNQIKQEKESKLNRYAGGLGGLF